MLGGGRKTLLCLLGTLAAALVLGVGATQMRAPKSDAIVPLRSHSIVRLNLVHALSFWGLLPRSRAMPLRCAPAMLPLHVNPRPPLFLVVSPLLLHDPKSWTDLS